jgi:hypothetical protein
MHSLRTMAFLHDNLASQARMNATDPGRIAARAAEERLVEALAYVANSLEEYAVLADAEPGPQVEAVRRARAPEWSVTRHGDEFWALPLTAQARTVAQAIIPPGTRRYGMHYILAADDLVNQAIIESIQEAQNA